MKEYNNFYEREDVPLHWFTLQETCDSIKREYPDNVQEQKTVLLKECSKYWPLEVRFPDRRDIALKGGSTRESMKEVYKEFLIKLSSDRSCSIKAFKYQKKKWYYWWDMYQDSQLIRSGLEIFPWYNSPASYLIFATEQDQSPLLCGESFKYISQEQE